MRVSVSRHIRIIIVHNTELYAVDQLINYCMCILIIDLILKQISSINMQMYVCTHSDAAFFGKVGTYVIHECHQSFPNCIDDVK